MEMLFRDDLQEETSKVGVGRIFIINDEENIKGQNLYILSKPNENKELVLINIRTGIRYTDPSSVMNPYFITREEWCKITGGKPHIFEMVKIKELEVCR